MKHEGNLHNILYIVYILNKYKVDSTCNNNEYNDNNNSDV